MPTLPNQSIAVTNSKHLILSRLEYKNWDLDAVRHFQFYFINWIDTTSCKGFCKCTCFTVVLVVSCYCWSDLSLTSTCLKRLIIWIHRLLFRVFEFQLIPFSHLWKLVMRCQDWEQMYMISPIYLCQIIIKGGKKDTFHVLKRHLCEMLQLVVDNSINHRVCPYLFRKAWLNCISL